MAGLYSNPRLCVKTEGTLPPSYIKPSPDVTGLSERGQRGVRAGCKNWVPSVTLGERAAGSWRARKPKFRYKSIVKRWTFYTRCALVLVGILFVSAILNASALKQETLQAWDDYIRTVNSRLDHELAPGDRFLWIDEAPTRGERLRRNEIVVSPTREGNPQTVPHGLIHDWMGAVFIPAVTTADVFAVVQDYGGYQAFLKPTVVEAKVLDQTGEEYKFSLVGVKRVLFITIALAGEFESHCSQVDRRRWYCVYISTRIQEIQDYGHAGTRKLPPDEGHGYTWRFYGIARFEERDGGVYVELEAIGLTADVSAISWALKPFVERVSRDAMSVLLEQTREAVQSRTAH